MHEAKRNQRALTITLLDLRNAFGEVQHNLISSSLNFHHVPTSLTTLIMNIYTSATIQVSTQTGITAPIRVERGVLQGDPCSPLLFNICFNSLMRVIAQEKYQQLGYIWGSGGDVTSRAWMQFADDAAIIAKDCEGTQTLINVAAAWCKWADMSLRIDKCSTFGMHKCNGNYIQFKPSFFINGQPIPTVDIGSSFKYLGKLFDFDMKCEEIKIILSRRLTDMLSTVSKLSISTQMKLKILRQYFPTQFQFDLKSYDISLTWIEQVLDSTIVNCVRDWLSLPVSSCVAEILELPKCSGGLNISTMKSTAEKLRLSQRYALCRNKQPDMLALWRTTSSKNPNLDAVILSEPNLIAAKRKLNDTQSSKAVRHVENLVLQGALITAVTKILNKSESLAGLTKSTMSQIGFSSSLGKLLFSNWPQTLI